MVVPKLGAITAAAAENRLLIPNPALARAHSKRQVLPSSSSQARASSASSEESGCSSRSLRVGAMLMSNASISAVYSSNAPVFEQTSDAHGQESYMRIVDSETGDGQGFHEMALPQQSVSTASRPMVRHYTVFPTKNTFCCWGFCMTGPVADVGPNGCAWISILLPMAIFSALWGERLVQTSPLLLGAVWTCFASTILSLLVVSFTDPGILPRDMDAPSKPQPPLYRNRTDDDGTTITDTYCTTCRIYRPPRSSHCPDCDNCVRDFDHHCPFTRNCIGARNYAFFILFLVSVSLSLAALLFSCSIFYNEAKEGSEIRSVINLALLLFSVVMGLMLWGFTAYHVSLVISGLTTKEYIKGRKHGATRMSIVRRLECCCLPASELDVRAWVPAPSQSGGVPIIDHHQL